MSSLSSWSQKSKCEKIFLVSHMIWWEWELFCWIKIWYCLVSIACSWIKIASWQTYSISKHKIIQLINVILWHLYLRLLQVHYGKRGGRKKKRKGQLRRFHELNVLTNVLYQQFSCSWTPARTQLPPRCFWWSTSRLSGRSSHWLMRFSPVQGWHFLLLYHASHFFSVFGLRVSTAGRTIYLQFTKIQQCRKSVVCDVVLKEMKLCLRKTSVLLLREAQRWELMVSYI